MPKATELKDHPLANIFPLLNEDRLLVLADDIKTNGLNNPITLFEAKILDGRNRYRACMRANITPTFNEFTGDDPVSFVVSCNAVRRDLTKSQRAAAAVNCEEIVERFRAEAKERQGTRTDIVAKLPLSGNGEKTRDQLAKLFGCAARYIQDAFAIKAIGVRLDELRNSKEPEFKDLAVKHAGLRRLFDELLNDAKSVSDANRELDRLDYDVRVATAAVEKRAVPQIVVADPPWQYLESSTTDSRQIENQYKTASLEEIKSHAPVTAPDAVLFLWATAPLLPNALEVMAAWDFKYRTNLVWDKEAIGLGNWSRIQHEHLLIGIRGKPEHPPEHLRIGSVLRSKRKGHSEKPEEVFEWLDKCYPGLRKLEMYARKKREGWSVWGNEI